MKSNFGCLVVLRRDFDCASLRQAYTTAMQTQWGWLLQLTVCLETHMRHAAAYHGWWDQARETDAYLGAQANRLNSYYTRPHVSLDEGEKLMREMEVSHGAGKSRNQT